MILTEKFYLFDVGVANYLARRRPRIGSAEFGKSFEHYLLMEIKAFQAYRMPDLPLAYWRTSTGQEVDFILGEKELAVEIKGSRRVHDADLRGMEALLQDGPVRKAILVCLEDEPRRVRHGIEILPWRVFLRRLWEGRLVGV
jgi:predicted AAA+ superfamily ATPase